MVVGDITEISCAHETLGDFFFRVKSGADFNLDLGGFVNNDDAQSIDGQGDSIIQKNRKRWSGEGTVIWDLVTRQDLKSLQDLADSPIEGTWTFASVTGAVYKGKGIPVGDLVGNMQNGEVPLKVSGSNIAEKIA